MIIVTITTGGGVFVFDLKDPDVTLSSNVSCKTFTCVHEAATTGREISQVVDNTICFLGKE